LLIHTLARLKHDRQTEIRFNARPLTERGIRVEPLLRLTRPPGSGPV
jgi:hypothetical protein